jgi:hypothetical protein
MKKAISLLFLVLTMTTTVYSAPSSVMAVVSGLKGQAFYSIGGKTLPLKTGMHLSSQTEIFTEVGAQVSINDYYDHIYHLSGGGHMIVHRNLIELKEGYLWVKSLAYDELKGPLRVNTANAIAENATGEGIISYDSYSGKTQILTVKGNFIFRNSLNEFQNIGLTEGQFSFIQNDHENGSPRRPTPIGYASYQKVTSLFSDVEAIDKTAMQKQRTYPTTSPVKKAVTKRFPASKKPSKVDPFAKVLGEVSSNPETTKAGHTTIIKLRSPASIKKNSDNLLNYYQKKVKKLATPAPKKKWKRTYKQKKSSVPVVIYGASTSRRSKQRYPASIAPSQATRPSVTKSRTPASVGRMLPEVKASPFESALGRQYKKQMRHEKQVNDLIDQLKSIDMDYKKDY